MKNQKPRTYDSMKAASAAMNLPIETIRRAKEKGCPAFSSNRIYEAELLRWLVDHPERQTAASLVIESPAHGAHVLAEMFALCGIEYWSVSRAAFWLTMNSLWGRSLDDPALKGTHAGEFIGRVGDAVKALDAVAALAPIVGAELEAKEIKVDISAWLDLGIDMGGLKTADDIFNTEKKKFFDHPEK